MLAAHACMPRGLLCLSLRLRVHSRGATFGVSRAPPCEQAFTCTAHLLRRVYKKQKTHLMRPSPPRATMKTSFVAILALVGAAVARPQARSQCAGTLATASTVAHRMVSEYYNSNTGQYNGGELWTDSNALEDLHNWALAYSPPSKDFSTIASTSLIGRMALENASSSQWASLIAGSNDDAQWIILALLKVADYYGSTGQSATPFNNAAITIYNQIAAQWDNTCGGGVWWSTAHTYKNAVTNELFLLTSTSCYLRFGTQSCLDNANKAWNWLYHSGMRNSQGLWNDGLTSACANNGQTTWTYNQGVIASGLAGLYAATGSKNTTLLDQAEITLDATIKYLTTNNILKESCDDAQSGGAVCDNDQLIFKGIWTKHVQYYLDMANTASRTAKYSGFLGSQYSAVYHYAKSASNDLGSVWYAPNAGGSVFKPQSQTSGLAAIVAAAKYAAC